MTNAPPSRPTERKCSVSHGLFLQFQVVPLPSVGRNMVGMGTECCPHFRHGSQTKGLEFFLSVCICALPLWLAKSEHEIGGDSHRSAIDPLPPVANVGFAIA